MRASLSLAAVLVVAAAVAASAARPIQNAPNGGGRLSVRAGNASDVVYAINNITRLEKIDMDAKTETPISKSYLTGMSEGLSTADKKNGIFYFMGVDPQTGKATLIGLDIADGSEKVKLALDFVTVVFIGVGMSIDFIPETGEVVVSGMIHTTTKMTHAINAIHPMTGKVRHICDIGHAAIGVLGAESILDDDTSTLYLQLAKNSTKTDNKPEIFYYEIDIKSGKHIEHTPLTEENFLEGQQWDNSKQKIVGYLGSQTGHQMAELDPKTLEVTPFGQPIPDFVGGLGGISALDVKGRLYYGLWGSRKINPDPTTEHFTIVEVDADTGVMKKSNAICDGIIACIWMLESFA